MFTCSGIKWWLDCSTNQLRCFSKCFISDSNWEIVLQSSSAFGACYVKVVNKDYWQLLYQTRFNQRFTIGKAWSLWELFGATATTCGASIWIGSCHLVSEEQYFFREFIVSGSWDSSVRIWNRSKSYSLLFPLINGFVCSETAEGAAIKIRFPPAFKATVWIFFSFQDWWQAAIPLHSSAWKVSTIKNVQLVHCLPSLPREISGVNISGNRILVTSLAGSLNVIERQGRETFLVKRFFPESQVTQANPSIIEKNTSGSWRNLFPCLWQQFHHDRVKLSYLYPAVFIFAIFPVFVKEVICFKLEGTHWPTLRSNFGGRMTLKWSRYSYSMTIL